MKPNPANVTLKPIDARSMEIHYLIDHNLAYFQPGFSQLTRFKSERSPTWVSLEVTDLSAEASDHLIKMDNLVPFTEYTVEFKYISRVVSFPTYLVPLDNMLSLSKYP